MIQIVEMTEKHWPAVSRIYQEGIDTGNATFEHRSPTWETWDAAHLNACRIVAVEDEIVIGWAALSAVSRRPVYSGVAEVSVYVATSFRGRGIGGLLLRKLIELSEANGTWTLQAGIFPENSTSIVLHEHCGFRQVGIREKIGQMQGQWRDVVLMERRSQSVGLEQSP